MRKGSQDRSRQVIDRPSLLEQVSTSRRHRIRTRLPRTRCGDRIDFLRPLYNLLVSKVKEDIHTADAKRQPVERKVARVWKQFDTLLNSSPKLDSVLEHVIKHLTGSPANSAPNSSCGKAACELIISRTLGTSRTMLAGEPSKNSRRLSVK